MTGYSAYPPPPPEQNYQSGSGQLAGWWRRVGASLIDGIIVGVVASVIAIATGNNTGTRVGLEVVLSVVYTVALLGSRGRTVGNLAVSTQVVPVEGGQLTYGKAFLRWLIQELLAATVIGGLLDILWPLWDSRNQTLHDKAVGTLVVMR